MRLKYPLLISLVLLLVTKAAAQGSRPVRASDPPDSRTAESYPNDPEQELNLPDEMRTRLRIERAEGEHRKFLEDVQELTDLTNELAEGYRKRGSLSHEDIKKLGAVEKVAKRVLGRAGGAEVDDKTGQFASMPIAEAIDRLNTTANGIKKTAMAESRHVVSAAIIGGSNEIINLVQSLRRAKKLNN